MTQSQHSKTSPHTSNGWRKLSSQQSGEFEGSRPVNGSPIGEPQSIKFSTPVVSAEYRFPNYGEVAIKLTSSGATRTFPEMAALRGSQSLWTLQGGKKELANLGVSVAITTKIAGRDYLMLSPQIKLKDGIPQNSYWRLPGGYLNQSNSSLSQAIALQAFDEMRQEIIPTSNGVVVGPLQMQVGRKVPPAIGQAIQLPVQIDNDEISGSAIYFDRRYKSAQIVLSRTITEDRLVGISLSFAEERAEKGGLQSYYYENQIRLVPLDKKGNFAFDSSGQLPSFNLIDGKLKAVEAISPKDLSPSFTQKSDEILVLVQRAHTAVSNGGSYSHLGISSFAGQTVAVEAAHITAPGSPYAGRLSFNHGDDAVAEVYFDIHGKPAQILSHRYVAPEAPHEIEQHDDRSGLYQLTRKHSSVESLASFLN